MHVDTTFQPGLASAARQARWAEVNGFDAIWSIETANDPFLPLALGAAATERIMLGTGIAVAFARSPMTVAQSAWDLQALSGGRFLLGLGSQIKPHIERRFGMPWSRPAARMREYVCALRAIWACWQHDVELQFQGEFYTHTLMTPFFNPGPIAAGAPPLFVAAVGEAMTRVAAQVADGLLLHRFTTPRYLMEVTLPALEAAAAGREPGLDRLQVALPAFAAVGDNEGEILEAIASTRRQIAFYASTPAYRPVLDLHGWGELQPELQALTRQGRWAEMDGLIDDAILTEFTVVGTPEECADLLNERFACSINRLSPSLVSEVRPELRERLRAAMRPAARPVPR